MPVSAYSEALAVVPTARAAEPPAKLAPYFKPPAEFANDFGTYRSPLKFDDGTDGEERRRTGQKRRAEILKYWHGAMGEWPPLIEKPKVEYSARRSSATASPSTSVRIEVAPGRTVDDAYLLVPDGKGPFPAVLVVFYDANTGVGLGKAGAPRLRLPARPARVRRPVARRRPEHVLPDEGDVPHPAAVVPRLRGRQLLHTRWRTCPSVDPKRVGVVGHSYGGKWAMFAACLYDKFACGGVVRRRHRVRREARQRELLGAVVPRLRAGLKEQRKPGIPNDKNPRTGPYKKLMADGRDLHELHALMAPRPFLVSGGSEDPPERWKALNHAVAVNKLLGAREPRRDDQPPGALARRRSRTSSCTCSSSRS